MCTGTHHYTHCMCKWHIQECNKFQYSMQVRKVSRTIFIIQLDNDDDIVLFFRIKEKQVKLDELSHV